MSAVHRRQRHLREALKPRQQRRIIEHIWRTAYSIGAFRMLHQVLLLSVLGRVVSEAIPNQHISFLDICLVTQGGQ
jgi:hypothetical protein